MSDITLTIGSTTYGLNLAKDANGKNMCTQIRSLIKYKGGGEQWT